MNSEVAEWLLRDQPSEIVEKMRRPFRPFERMDFLSVPGWDHEHDQRTSYVFHVPDWVDLPGRSNEYFGFSRGDELILDANHEYGRVVQVLSQLLGRASAGADIPASRVLAGLANGWSLSQVSHEFDIEREEITRLLRNLATLLENSKLTTSIHAPSTFPTRPNWVATLEAGGVEEPDGATYQKVADSLIDLVEVRDYRCIVEIFHKLNVKNVSTDYLVMLLRLTFAVRSNIENWQEFLSKTRDALTARGSEADHELLGLDSDDSVV